MVLYVPVRASNTRFFWMFAINVLRVCRFEWLRVLPKAVPLPVLMHLRAITGKAYVEALKRSISIKY